MSHADDINHHESILLRSREIFDKVSEVNKLVASLYRDFHRSVQINGTVHTSFNSPPTYVIGIIQGIDTGEYADRMRKLHTEEAAVAKVRK